MVNLAEKHDEENSTQLADAEISRILTALQKAEFKRSESGNARPDQTFKPRSLMEIAQTARQQDEAAKATEMAIADTLLKNTEDQPDQINTDYDRQGADLATATNTADSTMQAAAMPIGDADQSSAGPTDTESSDGPQLNQEASSQAGELPSADSGEVADSKDNGGADHEADSAAPTSPFETAQVAYDRGYSDGVATGREATEAELRATIEAEFGAKLADKINAFETALTALAKPQTVDTRDLSASLQTAVVRLAAARTGVEIDELPELMVKRIENLADAAGKNVSTGHVFMHPDDCAVIAPIMETRQDHLKIEPDPGLYRGDIRIRFDGMDISDIADLRADWQISQSMAHRNSAEFETSQTKISEFELENRNADILSLDAPDASVQSSTISSSPTDSENGKPLIDDNEDNEDASTSEAIGLMPLTTTGGDDPVSDGVTRDNEDASSSEAIGLMPLTTTGGDASASDQGTGDNEDASTSEAIGLMPLTSKNIEE